MTFVCSQVILKQQRVIKRLLKKCHGDDNCAGGAGGGAGEKDTADEDSVIKMLASDVAAALGGVGAGNGGGKRLPGNADVLAAHTGNGKTALQLFDGQNDSDSAIMLEDHLTDVGISELPLRK